MISSPPQEAEHIRGKTLTPESPKPVHYPSPSNIPILEKSMDPLFHETVGTPSSFQSFSQQNQTPSAQSNPTFYPEQQNVPNYHGAATSGSVGAGAGDNAQSAGYGNGYGQNTQDTSIQSFSLQNQALATPYSEAKSAPGQDNRSPYPMFYAANTYAPAPSQAQPPQSGQYQPPSNHEGSGVTFQAILDNLNNQSNDRNATPSMPSQPPQIYSVSSLSSLPAPSNLPPRPPMQDKPAIHPNYNPDDDIRSYHPHSQKQQNSQYRGPGQLQPLHVPNTPTDSSYPPSASRQNQTPSTPSYRQRESVDLRGGGDDDEDARWPPEINRLYEEFLEDERKFVTDGQWDQFPVGSRLFIGNLPTEKVTKRDIFHRFYRHGKLAQISIKQAYGFVQFLDANACHRALQEEQGSQVRGRKMHLEISKPQRNTKKSDAGNTTRNGARRRSASPDYSRGGSISGGRGVDRYTNNAVSPRESTYRRGRDDYRPMRSPSPRGGRGRRDRSRDRYDRRRSRSRSPLGRGGGRYRSPSPRADPDDDLPLPHRAPQEVPDVQVIVVDDLSREFIGWVEDIFRQRGLRIDVLILSPRLSEAAVVRRQIIEGVLAIVKLNSAAMATGRISLQVFDRRGGPGKVQFEEYADLDPTTAAMLALTKKQSLVTNSSAAIPLPYAPTYSAAPATAAPYATAQPPAYQYPPTSDTPQLSNLISSLDSNSLQKLLGAMSQNSAPQAPQPPAGLAPDLARLLGSMSAPPSQQPSTPAAFQNPYVNPALASIMSQAQSQQASQGRATGPAPNQPSPAAQPDMNAIMAQLASYRQR